MWKLDVYISYEHGRRLVSEVEIKPEHTREGIIEVFADRLREDDAVNLELRKNIMVVLRLEKEEDGSIAVREDLIDWMRKEDKYKMERDPKIVAQSKKELKKKIAELKEEIEKEKENVETKT